MNDDGKSLTPESLEDKFVRDENCTVIATDACVITIRKDGVQSSITEHVALCVTLLEITRAPTSMQQLCTSVCVDSSILRQILSLLLSRGAIRLEGPAKRTGSALALKSKRVCLGICGSVHCLASPQLITALRERVTEEVEVIVTSGAQRFVNPRGLEYLGVRVWTDLHERRDNIQVPHAWLAEQCDLVLVVPASAHALHRLALAECSDLLSLLISMTSAPIILAPAMNPLMWMHPPILKNIALLRSAGFYIVEPGLGYIVSSGTSRVEFCSSGLNVENIVDVAKAVLSTHSAAKYEKALPLEVSKNTTG